MAQGGVPSWWWPNENFGLRVLDNGTLELVSLNGTVALSILPDGTLVGAAQHFKEIADPVDPLDVANKEYVDTHGGGGGGVTVYQQDTDPGAVGAGKFWVNTSLSVGQPADSLPLYVRDAGNTGWIAQGLAYYVGSTLKSFVTVGDAGVVAEVFTDLGVPVGGLAIYGDGGVGTATVLRSGNAYLHFQAGQLYFNRADGQPFWIQGLAGPTWGIADPSGAEKFWAMAEPDDSEIAVATREHWYDDAMGAPALRFKQKDTSGTLSVGRAAGIIAGFLKLAAGEVFANSDETYTLGDGGLLGDDGANFVDVQVGGVIAGSDSGAADAEVYSMTVGHGIQSNPPVGVAAFTAKDLAGGTIALDAGALFISNVEDPALDQDAATKHYVDTHLTAGATGPTGPQGPDGLDGNAGPQGATGPSGTTGGAGATGNTGAAGASGAPGPQGLDGLDGGIGPQGSTGPQGASGTAGAAGATGPQGLDGLDGGLGPQGSTGPAGATGNTGPTGNTGTAGSAGATGNTGSSGPAGLDGLDGQIGPAGATGTAGAAGATGNTGPAGATGTLGFALVGLG